MFAVLTFVGIPLCLGMSSKKKKTSSPTRTTTPTRATTPTKARVTTPTKARATTPTKARATTPTKATASTKKATTQVPATRKLSAPRGTSLGKEQVAARRGAATPLVSSKQSLRESKTAVKEATKAPAKPTRAERRAATKAAAPAKSAPSRRAAKRAQPVEDVDGAEEAPKKSGFGDLFSKFSGAAKGFMASDAGKAAIGLGTGIAGKKLEEVSGGKISGELVQTVGAVATEKASGGPAEGEPSAQDKLLQIGVGTVTKQVQERSGGKIPDELTQAAGAVVLEKASGVEPEEGESALDALKQTAIQTGVGKVTEEVGARTGDLPPEVQALTGAAQAAALEKAEEQLTGKEESEEGEEGEGEVTPPAQKEEVTPAAPEDEEDGEEGEEDADAPAPQAEEDEAAE